jgi:hypothetical protein
MNYAFYANPCCYFVFVGLMVHINYFPFLMSFLRHGPTVLAFSFQSNPSITSEWSQVFFHWLRMVDY